MFCLALTFAEKFANSYIYEAQPTLKSRRATAEVQAVFNELDRYLLTID